MTALRLGLCYRKSVCRLSVVCNVRAPYFWQYFFAVSTLAIFWPPCKILGRSSQGNPSVGRVKRKRGSKIERCHVRRSGISSPGEFLVYNYSQILVKSRQIFTPLLYATRPVRSACPNGGMMFGKQRARMAGDWQTDGIVQFVPRLYVMCCKGKMRTINFAHCSSSSRCRRCRWSTIQVSSLVRVLAAVKVCDASGVYLLS